MVNSAAPKTRRKSVQIVDASPASMTSSASDFPRSDPSLNKRRSSSFASTSSPWFRRNSFLSPSMIQNENFSVYDSPSFFSDSASYNIISLKECQGFIFNQDLFASPYQQSRSLANERKTRALSFSKSKSRSNSRSQHKSPVTISGKGCSSPAQRRHTSYHFPRPLFLGSNDSSDNAVMDDDEDFQNEDKKPFLTDDEKRVTTDDINNNQNLGERDEEHEEEEAEEEEEDEDAVVNEYDEYDEYEEMSGYGGDSTNRRYKVHVTEIVINEDDQDIFPS